MSTEALLTITRVPREASASGIAFLVGFFFSARMVIVLFCARILGLEPRVGSAVSVSLNLLLLVLVCFHSVGPSVYPIKSLLRLATVRWVLLYLAFTACSFAWTIAISPSTSFAYWCALVADVCTVLVLLCGGSTRTVSYSLFKGFIWSTCLLSLIVWVMPAQSDLRLGDPDFFNTNQIGDLCALSILFVQLFIRRSQGKWGLITIFLLVTLLRSLSKSTLAAFVVCEVFLVFPRSRHEPEKQIPPRRGRCLIAPCVLGPF